MSQEQVNLDVTIDDKDMFDFNLYHTYHSKNGWLAIIFGVAAVVAAFVTYGRVTRAYTTIYVMIGFVCGASVLASSILRGQLMSEIQPNLILALVAFVGIGIYILSWYLSVVFFKKREIQ